MDTKEKKNLHGHKRSAHYEGQHTHHQRHPRRAWATRGIRLLTRVVRRDVEALHARGAPRDVYQVAQRAVHHGAHLHEHTLPIKQREICCAGCTGSGAPGGTSEAAGSGAGTRGGVG